MDAVGVIKENMDVERILNHYGVDFQYYGEFIRCACPIHKGDNPTAFVVNEEFLWACHTNSDCGVGDVFTFIEKVEDVSFPQAVKIVAQILEIDIDNLIIAERKNDYLKEVERFMKYIKSKRRTTKVIEEYTPNAEMSSVKSFRNFNEETLRRFDLRYAKEIEVEKKSGGTFTLYERLVIPIIIDEIRVGVSLRKIRAKDNPKWFHAPHTMETGQILYNIDSCKGYGEIIVCEGMFDVWRWYEAGYENAVCTFGAHLTEEQYRILLRSGKDVIWSYDGDEAGLNATKKAIDMMRYKTNQWVIKMPDGVDPGSCEIQELQRLYKQREKVL
nr:MAG TPA: DNA directed DNA polymerase [Caudoviricetes sp.]